MQVYYFEKGNFILKDTTQAVENACLWGMGKMRIGAEAGQEQELLFAIISLLELTAFSYNIQYILNRN